MFLFLYTTILGLVDMNKLLLGNQLMSHKPTYLTLPIKPIN